MIKGYKKAKSDKRCCGACRHFLYEDTDGFGYCNVGKMESVCGYVCQKFDKEPEGIESCREAE